MGSVRIQVPFRSCLKYSLTLIGSVIGFAIVLDIISKGFGEAFRTMHVLKQPVDTLAVLLGLTAGLAVAMYGIFWAVTTWVSREGISSRSLLGKTNTIPWTEISSMEPMRNQGIPMLRLRSHSGAQVFVATLGLDLRAVHGQLSDALGADHAFTRLFEGDRV